MTALKAMTIWPAWQHFEEDVKGSIETGKLADFVILDKDPSSVDPETLDQIKVLETIKEGVTVFDITDMKKSSASLRPGHASELAFTRAVSMIDTHAGHRHYHEPGNVCLCAAMARFTAIITRGGDH
jgi:hypothetical protein